jgi:hypothetical protein
MSTPSVNYAWPLPGEYDDPWFAARAALDAAIDTDLRAVEQNGIVRLTNRTGGALVLGDVVGLDVTADASAVLEDVQATQKPVVVALGAIAAGAVGRFGYGGNVMTVKTAGAVTRGRYLRKAATTKVVEDTGVSIGSAQAAPSGAVGVALSGVGGAGTVQALWLISLPLPAIVTQLNGSAAWNPGALLNGQAVTTTVAVAGAVAGDFCVVSFDVVLPDGMYLAVGQVTAAGVVTVTLVNASGATQDLGAGTLRARTVGH